MLAALHYAGDALWILAMSLIASTSRGALKRVSADVRMPMRWGRDGRPTWRAPRNLALGGVFGLPLVLGLALSAFSRLGVEDAQGATFLFLVRAATAGAFAAACLIWLRASLRALEDERAVSA